MDIDLTRLQELENQLQLWREERHISTMSQRPSLLANFLEELTELERARLQDDIEGQIDAYCDMLVFLLNAYPFTFSLSQPTIDSNLKIFKDTNSLNKYKFLRDILSYIEYLVNVDDIPNAYSLVNSISLLTTAIYSLNYNPLDCLQETIKEISSRTGTWDNSIQKFIKDTSPEAKSNWYQANYSSCQLHQDNN